MWQHVLAAFVIGGCAATGASPSPRTPQPEPHPVDSRPPVEGAMEIAVEGLRPAPSSVRPLRIRDAEGNELWRCVSPLERVSPLEHRASSLRCLESPSNHAAGSYVVHLPDPSVREAGDEVPLELSGDEVRLSITRTAEQLSIERVHRVDPVSVSAPHRATIDVAGSSFEVVAFDVVLPERFCAWGGWGHWVDLWSDGTWRRLRSSRQCQCGRCGQVEEVTSGSRAFAFLDGDDVWYREDRELVRADPVHGCDVQTLGAHSMPDADGDTAAGVAITDIWIERFAFRPDELPLEQPLP